MFPLSWDFVSLVKKGLLPSEMVLTKADMPMYFEKFDVTWRPGPGFITSIIESEFIGENFPAVFVLQLPLGIRSTISIKHHLS